MRYLIAALLLTGAVSAQAQIVDPAEPFGTIFSTEFDTEVLPADAAKMKAVVTYSVIPGYVRPDNGQQVGVTFGIARKSDRHPFQIRLGYTSIQTDGSPDRDSGSVNAKVQVAAIPVKDERAVILTAVGDYRHVRDVQQRYGATLAASYKLLPQLGVAANLGYTLKDPETGASAEDATLGAGVTYTISPTLEISADYSFKNDVDKADNFGVGFAHSPKFLQPKNGSVTLNAGVVKHGTVKASILVKF